MATNLLASKPSIDPTLAALFASSSGPVKVPKRATQSHRSKIEEDGSISSLSEDEELEDEDDEEVEDEEAEDDEDEDEDGDETAEKSSKPQGKKRKNAERDDNLEGAYMDQLAREEAKEEAQLRKRQKTKPNAEAGSADGSDGSKSDVPTESEESDQDEESDIPVHESLTKNEEANELEKASRTVFLGNVSTSTITSKSDKKTLIKHLSSFLSSLPEQQNQPHKVESLRFRSTAFSSAGVPKKAAFAKKELMDATTKSTNAYAVYSTAIAARKAAEKLNGTVVLNRHLRVDGVAHPSKVDHRRCVFVGNLGFVDDDSKIKAAQDGQSEQKKKTKTKEAADVEEGLWRQFGKAGTVESVRVIRDAATRVGKGFAYVQFTDPNAVETALLYNDQKYPPLLPRKLRVTRAKSLQKTATFRIPKPSPSQHHHPKKTQIYNPKPTPEGQTLAGRASKLLGVAGARHLHDISTPSKSATGANSAPVRTRNSNANTNTDKITPPESFVFEGHRASSKQGKPNMKMKGKAGGRRVGKPKTRSSRRGAAFKAAGGVKKRQRI
ncbi:MAG: Nucleolar protein 12 [Cirrosporium novae-zelandiae]|nr:MAG: Nucleolar protein 12 [Cirrosporium novae-zelandiae]